MRSPLPTTLLPLTLLAACSTPAEPGGLLEASTTGSTTAVDPAPTSTPTTGATEPDTTSSSTSTASSTDTGDAGSTASTLDPPMPGCGDGIVDPPTEQCDDGYGQNSDLAACTLHCQINICGDKNLLVGVEECDEGANNNDDDTLYGACGTDCRRTNYCGDSEVQGPEECDLGANNGSGKAEIGGVGCDFTCRFDAKLCFLTSAVFKANSFLGAKQADDACRTAALDAGFDNAPGFMAWISDDTSSPATRFTPSTLPYVLPNGIRVASHSKQLMSTGPDAGITRTDKGEDLLQALVWTGTAPNGTLTDPALDCEGWTSSGFEHEAAVGLSGVDKQDLDSWNLWKYEDHWTRLKSVHSAHSYHLYCFEQ